MNSLSLQDAVQVLRGNGVLVYPTETFYAIGGNALSRDAVAAVYAAKERDKHFPLPVIIGDFSQLELIADCSSHHAMDLAECFWPGPLTILFTASASLPTLLTGGTGKVAVRLSSHPAARDLCLEAGFPLISSSANISNRPPVTDKARLDSVLLNSIGGALYDAAPLPEGGEPSTIVEVANTAVGGRFIRILRQGAISADKLMDLGFACHKHPD